MKKILGTMRLPETHEGIKNWLKTAHEAGYDWLDLAYVYGGEDKNAKLIAPVLKELREEGVTFKLQTKIWTTFFKETEKYFHLQLANLGVEKFDSILLHRPSVNFYESIEAWSVLVKLKAQGLVDEIGVSNFENDMIRLLILDSGVKPTINQIEHSIQYYRADRTHFAKSLDIEIQGWSPMGSDPKGNLEIPSVVNIAKKYNVHPSQVLMSYLTTMGVAPVIGTLNNDNLKLNVTWIKLSNDDINELQTCNNFVSKFEESYPMPDSKRRANHLNTILK